MRGPAERQAKMLMGVTTEDFIPAGHPIRRVRRLVDELLVALSPQLTAMYAADGRYSVPPEHLIKSSLLMGFYSIRSERQFCERLQYDLLFKWFLGLNITDNAFDHSTFSKNRKRLMEHQVAEALLGEVVREARKRRLISEDHFSVDGTLPLRLPRPEPVWKAHKSVCKPTAPTLSVHHLSPFNPRPRPSLSRHCGQITQNTALFNTLLGSRQRPRRHAPRLGMLNRGAPLLVALDDGPVVPDVHRYWVRSDHATNHCPLGVSGPPQTL